jgi:hypothetical protein
MISIFALIGAIIASHLHTMPDADAAEEAAEGDADDDGVGGADGFGLSGDAATAAAAAAAVSVLLRFAPSSSSWQAQNKTG